MLAGGGTSQSEYYNTKFWLHTADSYWTMTPFQYNNSSRVVFVNSNGAWWWGSVNNNLSIRPVINVIANAKFVNDSSSNPGSSTNPYEVVVT